MELPGDRRPGTGIALKNPAIGLFILQDDGIQSIGSAADGRNQHNSSARSKEHKRIGLQAQLSGSGHMLQQREDAPTSLCSARQPEITPKNGREGPVSLSVSF
jgi:hypothetical protein